MDQVHVIRHKVLIEGRSQRRVARELGISRLTVRKYLQQAVPVRVERTPRPRPVWAAVKDRTEALLEESKHWTTKKQRLTATRLWELLIAEGHKVGRTVVKEIVAEWKRQRREVFVPLAYHPGELAEVDFFEGWVEEGAARIRAWLFLLRLMFSGRDFAWIYRRQDQVSFLDGHVRAFEHLGGVPVRVAYDNLRPAVRRILVGGERLLTTRFAALASHYLFEPCFCRPATGHDKGGVEARGKTLRWQHLVPIPTGPSLGAINEALLARLDGRMSTRRSDTTETIGERWAIEVAQLRPLAPPFQAARTEILAVSPRALVRLDGAYDSVPDRWTGLDVVAHVGAEQVEIVGPEARRIGHTRQRFGQRAIDYRHYLRTLATKPQAVRQVMPELLADLGPPFPALWAHLEAVHGPREAARVFAKVLGAVETHGWDAVVPALAATLRDGTPLTLAVLVPPTSAALIVPDVVPIALRDLAVESGQAADYDAWLTGGVQ